MARVMIMCPTFNRPVPTGMGVANEQAFNNSSYQGNAFQCSACFKTHTWNGRDAWVETAPPTRPPSPGAST